MMRLLGKVLVSSPLLNMTLTGSVIILFVLLARLCLKRAPKVYSYALWGVVLFRLLCPVSITAPVSALNIVRPEVTAADNSINLTMYVANVPAASRTITSIAEQPVVDTQSSGTAEKQADPMIAATAVWAMGLLAMAGHGFVGFLRLRKKLIGAVEVSQGVFLADGIDTPFVLGVLRPKIYLPSGIPIAQRPLILAHERYHIRRLDMLWKLLGYLALCLHWFNPLVWAAFVLAGKDMEMSCDEAVLRKLDKAHHADYAAALLRLSTGRRTIAGTPLAFGEGDVKSRIRNMANWKKPKVWVSLLCVLLCVAAAAVFLTNPAKDKPQNSGKYAVVVNSYDVYSIQVIASSGSGGIIDGFPFAYGERVILEPLNDLESWAGVNIKALGKDGEKLWEFTVPDSLADYSLIEGDCWVLERTDKESGHSTRVLGGPLDSRIGALTLKIPEDISLQTTFIQKEGHFFSVVSFFADGVTIGGVNQFPMETVPTDGLGWIHDLDLPEWKMDNIGYYAEVEGSDNYSIEFFSDVPPGVERTVLNKHHLYYFDGFVYDLWFDEMKADERTRSAIQRTVYLYDTISAPAYPEVSDTYEIGALPEGYTFDTDSSGSIIFTNGTIAVGGIDVYPIPLNTYDPEDGHFEWLERAGISDFGDTTLTYAGGMTFFANQWTAYFTSDNPKAERHHRFQIAGNYVYDTWFDGLSVDYDTQQALLAAIQLKAPGLLPDEEHTIHSQSDEEETAYQTISAFLNALQENQAAYVVQDRQPVGAKAPGARNSYLYLAEGNLYYNETEMLPDGTMRERAVVRVERQQYTGTSLRFGDDLTWSKTEGEDPYMWLTSIDWNRQTFRYVATMNDPNGTVYLYHSDLWYEEDDGGYFVNFYFNEEGQFDHVTIRVNQFMDNDYEVTESILSTDSTAISEWINREYRKAIDKQ